MFQGNKVKGAGEYAILVDDAEDNILVGNNVNGFAPLFEHVVFLEDAVGNYYVGRGNLVNDVLDQNTITGVDRAVGRKR